MRFSAVFFDLDGTLINSEAIGIEASLAVCAKLGIEQDRSFFESLIGQDDKTCLRLLVERFPGIDFETHMAMFADEVRRLETGHLPKMPGVDRLLADLGTLGVPMAVVTSSRGDRAAWKLKRADLAHHFQTVVSVDDVTRPKPAAEPYLLAARRLSVTPAQCLVFEDSDTGAASGKAAGMTVVQIPDIGRVSGASADIVAPNLLDGAREVGLVATAA